jgi:hypothetical protein
MASLAAQASRPALNDLYEVLADAGLLEDGPCAGHCGACSSANWD